MVIDLLNQMIDKTPAEIAKKLKNKGWRRPSELTREFFDDEKLKPYYYYQIRRDGFRGSQHIAQQYEWKLSHCSTDYDYFVRVLDTEESIYFVIRAEDYTGELPTWSFTS